MTLVESDRTSRHSYKTWVAIFSVWFICMMTVPAAILTSFWLASLWAFPNFAEILFFGWWIGGTMAAMLCVDWLQGFMYDIEERVSALCRRWGR